MSKLNSPTQVSAPHADDLESNHLYLMARAVVDAAICCAQLEGASVDITEAQKLHLIENVMENPLHMAELFQSFKTTTMIH